MGSVDWKTGTTHRLTVPEQHATSRSKAILPPHKIDQPTVVQRLKALVAQAKQQERLDQRAWNWFWFSIPLSVIAFIFFALILIALPTGRALWPSGQDQIAYFLADKVTTKAVMVPRPYRRENPLSSIDNMAVRVAYAEKVAAKIASNSPVKFIPKYAVQFDAPCQHIISAVPAPGCWYELARPRQRCHAAAGPGRDARATSSRSGRTHVFWRHP